MTTRSQGAKSLVRANRPRWLAPVLVATFLAIVLVIGGVLSVSGVLYAGAIGAMLLMHLGGHGAHGGHPSGHKAHEEGAPAPGPDDVPTETSGGRCH